MTKLPPRDAVMKSEHNKKELIRLLCAKNHCPGVDMISEENHVFNHEEADCNIISYVNFLITEQGKKHIEVVADDTDIFVLLVYYC